MSVDQSKSAELNSSDAETLSDVAQNKPITAASVEGQGSGCLQIDLLCVYLIERVTIQGSIRGPQTKTWKVFLSIDNEHWTALDSDPAGKDLSPKDPVCARYVRFGSDSQIDLQSVNVEVLVRNWAKLLAEFHDRCNIDESSAAVLLSKYRIVNFGANIAGLDINYTLQFGNLLMQYINAVLLAEKTGLKYIRLRRHELTDPSAQITVGGLTFLPIDSPLPDEGAFISGSFFDPTPFVPVLPPFGQMDEVEACRVAREIIRPHFLTRLTAPQNEHIDDELTIHIRAGDVFGAVNPIDPNYTGWRGGRQPPLAFYTLVINRLISNGTISRVRLVFQDRGNPCVDALERLLASRGISFRIQSGALLEDISALIDAPHLVFGFGTFGLAVSRLSRRIKTVHFFAPEIGGSYAAIPGIDEVYAVHDRAGGYFRAYVEEWDNTPAQREVMISYPAESLEILELKINHHSMGAGNAEDK